MKIIFLVLSCFLERIIWSHFYYYCNKINDNDDYLSLMHKIVYHEAEEKIHQVLQELKEINDKALKEKSDKKLKEKSN